MRAHVCKWGNSLALRIPKPLALEIDLEEGSEVDVSVSDAALTVRPVTPKRYALEELLAGVTAENLHNEIDAGPAVGAEVW